MKICYFGSYNPNYPRNRILLKGLRLNGAEIIETNFNSTVPSLLSYPKVFLKNLTSDFDAIVIGYSDTRSIENFLAKLSSKKPIFFDPLFSQYDSLIIDRKLIKNPLIAKYIHFREFFFLKFADCIILDTNAHINYFKTLYPLDDASYERVFVGGDDSLTFPKKFTKNPSNFFVFFYGTYIPLHGIEYIIEAAQVLENYKEIVFILAGGGQTYNHIQNLAKKFKLTNVKFIPPLPFSKYNDYLNLADICLGIFGTSKKGENVIATKIFDALAVGKPVITRDSIAIREALKNEVNGILCEAGNGKSLAEAILHIKNDANLMKKMATNNYSLFKKNFTPQKIGNSLLKVIEKYI